MKKNLDTICVGDIMIEFLLPLPPKNSTMVTNLAHQELGGPAFNICWHLSNLGHLPRLVGPYGKQNQAMVTQQLRSANLERSGLIPIDGDTDTLFAMLKAETHYSVYLKSQVPQNMKRKIVLKCGSPACLILTGSRHAIIRKSLLYLANAFDGRLLAFNPSYAIYEYDDTSLIQILKKSDIVILNEQEAEHTRKTLRLRITDQIPRKSNGILVVTKGSRGCKIYGSRNVEKIESYAVKNSESVGAGDAFFSGFLHETLKGRPRLLLDFLGLSWLRLR